ncbi:peptidase inhibitor family I36 protein [Actinomadura roseirufa]|uniref:peptidase inhibitor family I36 protein n=1 Tax=Actinomadura roseirufa TaxID=2094049 RepID=UPI00104144B7|nr:peptidase inhibitor family I36 protein [Actinomadura roseirufa]
MKGKATAIALMVVSAGTAVLTAPAASAQQHGPKDHRCDNGEFCLYVGYFQHGSVAVDRREFEENVRAYTNIARSWRNLTGRDWYIYDQPHCRGNSYPLLVRDGTTHNLDTSWQHRIRSIARRDKVGQCRR